MRSVIDHAHEAFAETIATQIGGFLSPLDERSALVAKYERLALTDELTGLPNRRG